MSTIYVRDVSEGALRTLKTRAAWSGQSLQAYVRQILEAQASTLTPAEAAERASTIAARSAVTADDILNTLDDIREARQ